MIDDGPPRIPPCQSAPAVYRTRPRSDHLRQRRTHLRDRAAPAAGPQPPRGQGVPRNTVRQPPPRGIENCVENRREKVHRRRPKRPPIQIRQKPRHVPQARRRGPTIVFISPVTSADPAAAVVLTAARVAAKSPGTRSVAYPTESGPAPQTRLRPATPRVRPHSRPHQPPRHVLDSARHMSDNRPGGSGFRAAAHDVATEPQTTTIQIYHPVTYDVTGKPVRRTETAPVTRTFLLKSLAALTLRRPRKRLRAHPTPCPSRARPHTRSFQTRAEFPART
jgi:hypothetical protein